jgi:hypothetical protein
LDNIFIVEGATHFGLLVFIDRLQAQAKIIHEKNILTFSTFLAEMTEIQVLHCSNEVLGAFAKFRKATVGFVVSVCLPSTLKNSAP